MRARFADTLPWTARGVQHALPPGFVLKRDAEAMKAQTETISLEELIEKQRAELAQVCACAHVCGRAKVSPPLMRTGARACSGPT